MSHASSTSNNVSISTLPFDINWIANTHRAEKKFGKQAKARKSHDFESHFKDSNGNAQMRHATIIIINNNSNNYNEFWKEASDFSHEHFIVVSKWHITKLERAFHCQYIWHTNTFRHSICKFFEHVCVFEKVNVKKIVAQEHNIWPK